MEKETQGHQRRQTALNYSDQRCCGGEKKRERKEEEEEVIEDRLSWFWEEWVKTRLDSKYLIILSRRSRALTSTIPTPPIRTTLGGHVGAHKLQNCVLQSAMFHSPLGEHSLCNSRSGCWVGEREIENWNWFFSSLLFSNPRFCFVSLLIHSACQQDCGKD